MRNDAREDVLRAHRLPVPAVRIAPLEPRALYTHTHTYTQPVYFFAPTGRRRRPTCRARSSPRACAGSASGWATSRSTRSRARPTRRCGSSTCGRRCSGTQAMIDRSARPTPILRTMLENAKQEIKESNIDGSNSENTYYGRRLLQRVEYNTRVTDALITHELMAFYGKGGIPGITAGLDARHFARATKQDDGRHAHRPVQRLRLQARRCPSRTSRPARAGATCCRCARRYANHRDPLFSVAELAPFARPQNMRRVPASRISASVRGLHRSNRPAYAY